MNESKNKVAVIICAKDAADTISKAVTTALAQSQVEEVFVVDDGSSDQTIDFAWSADDNTGRLVVASLGENMGPSYARNLAIARTSSPLLCLLDADDFLSSTRIEEMLIEAGDDWDLVGDDILFIRDSKDINKPDRLFAYHPTVSYELTFEQFLCGNIPNNKRYRRELGFLKPIIKRSFLCHHKINYDERLRLGEDLVLYARCLLHGATFKIVGPQGYYAVERPYSLSALHSRSHIESLYTALKDLSKEAAGFEIESDALHTCLRSTKNNLSLRTALEDKKAGDYRKIAKDLGSDPVGLYYVITEILKAKCKKLFKKAA